jgi:hypothetical protein
MKRRIVRIAPLPAAKVAGAMYFAMGLLFIPFFLLTGVPSGNRNWSDVAFALAAPLIYGVFGLLFGCLGSWLYNGVARWFGGLEVTVSTDDGSHPEQRL